MVTPFLTALCFVMAGFVHGLTLEERLNELELTISLQAGILSQHESLVREQRDKLESVQNENSVLKNRVEVLENAIERFHKISDNNEKPDERNTRETEEYQQLVSGDVRRISTGDRSVHLHDRSQGRQVLNSPSSDNVAFHVHSLAPHSCLHDHETLVFVDEAIDVGNGYNNNDGIYVVPVSGTYVFTWTATDRGDWYMSEIFVNGYARGNIVANGLSSNAMMAHATGVIVANVVAGDHVYIRRSIGNGCNVDYSNFNDKQFATFSGWLLFESLI